MNLSTIRKLGLVCFAIISLQLLTSQALLSQESSIDYKLQKVNYSFIIDVSGSMVGKGTVGTPIDIFDSVKQFIHSYVDQLERGTNVFIYPYDAGLRDHKSWENLSYDRTAIHDYIDGLQATGQQTYIYQSLRDVFLKTREFVRERANTQEFTNIIILFTDGIDTSPTNITLQEALNDFQLTFDGTTWERKDDWFYYITLNVKLTKEDIRALKETEGTMPIESPPNTVMGPVMVTPTLRHLVFSNFQTDTIPYAIQGFKFTGANVAPILRADLSLKLPQNSHYTFELSNSEFSADSAVRFELIPFPDHDFEFSEIKGTIHLSPAIVNEPITILYPDISFVIPSCASILHTGIDVGNTHSPNLDIEPIDIRTSDSTRFDIPILLAVDEGHCQGEGTVLLHAEIFDEKGRAIPVEVRIQGSTTNTLVIPINQFIQSRELKKNVIIDWEEEEWTGNYVVNVDISSSEYAIDNPLVIIRGSFSHSMSVIEKLALAILLIVLVIALLIIAAWAMLGRSFSEALDYWLYLLRLKRPFLQGRLEWHSPDGVQKELSLAGLGRIGVGPAYQHWKELPASIIVCAKPVRGKSLPYVSVEKGNVTKKGMTGDQVFLRPGIETGFNLDDTLLFDDKNRIILKS